MHGAAESDVASCVQWIAEQRHTPGTWLNGVSVGHDVRVCFSTAAKPVWLCQQAPVGRATEKCRIRRGGLVDNKRDWLGIEARKRELLPSFR